jgi:ribosome-binding protein aMBF1 (putative translation factor)
MKKTNNTISEWLEKYGDPKVEIFIEKNLSIVVKINSAIREKGLSREWLGEYMNLNKSEVDSLLSGIHNFTLKELIKIESILGIDLI